MSNAPVSKSVNPVQAACTDAAIVLADVIRRHVSPDEVRRFNNAALLFGHDWAQAETHKEFLEANRKNAAALQDCNVKEAEAMAQASWAAVQSLRLAHPSWCAFDFGEDDEGNREVFDPWHHATWCSIITDALERVGFDAAATGLIATRLAQIHPYSPWWAWGKQQPHHGVGFRR